MAVVGIIVFCGVLVGLFAWLLNRPECPKDPREDQEQMEYLEAWKKKHERTDKEK
nr:MAG TPA: Mid2 like cell wall stress sensor [Caudoviricetes sp.]